jgi:putative transposase
MQFKTRKHPRQVFYINKEALNVSEFEEVDKNDRNCIRLELFKRKKLGPLRTRSKLAEWINKNIHSIDHDCQIIKHKGGEYYLNLYIDKKVSKCLAPHDIVVLDAGVRKSHTFYSPNGVVGEIGKDYATNILEPIHNKIDNLNSIASKIKTGEITKRRKKIAIRKKTRRNQKRKTCLHIRKRQALLRNKIKNNVRDLQWKAVNFLTTNFRTVVTTDFAVKKMTNKEERNISKGTTRKLLTLSHYEFRQKLLKRAKERGTRIIIACEAYTSKTCGRCGEIRRITGEIYKCRKCGLIIDRDINGARNILIKLLSDLIIILNKIMDEIP